MEVAGEVDLPIVTRLAIAALLLLLAAPFAAETQQLRKLPRIGVLSGADAESPRAAALRAGLRQYGYTEGKNIAIEWRPSLGKAERFPDLAAELARLKVDVIVASDNPAIAAAKQATNTIPIVMVLATDPVGTGFIATLARPGGNVTGLTFQATELQGKSLQLLKEAVPSASRLAVLWIPGEPGRQVQAKEAELAARALGLQVQLVGVRSPAELDDVFKVMGRERLDAVVIQASQMTFAHRARIAELAASNRLATIAWSGDMVEAGILMSYGASIPDLHRRAAYYVDRILKGAKAADLPVEQPTKFELVLNLRTAKKLGITIPKSLVLRADHVIE